MGETDRALFGRGTAPARVLWGTVWCIRPDRGDFLDCWGSVLSVSPAGCSQPAALKRNFTGTTLVDGVMLLWFLLTAPCRWPVALDIRSTPEHPVMKSAFVLFTAYSWPFGALLYVLGCRQPLPSLHEQYVSRRLRQAFGSTMHGVVGRRHRHEGEDGHDEFGRIGYPSPRPQLPMMAVISPVVLTAGVASRAPSAAATNAQLLLPITG
jgi:hypothetical protein